MTRNKKASDKKRKRELKGMERKTEGTEVRRRNRKRERKLERRGTRYFPVLAAFGME